jgi:hypothetical protein
MDNRPGERYEGDHSIFGMITSNENYYGTRYLVLDITDKDGRDGVCISGEHRMIQTTRRESKESKLRIQYSDNATIKF